jgi:hypothetical protein
VRSAGPHPPRRKCGGLLALGRRPLRLLSAVAAALALATLGLILATGLRPERDPATAAATGPATRLRDKPAPNRS